MATKSWRGGAPATKRRYIVTAALVWAANDKARITSGNKTLEVNVGAAATTADVILELIASVMATDYENPALPSGYTRNFGGRELAEFRDFIAEEHPTDPTKMYITAINAGEDFTITASEVTAGSGTLVATVDTAGTGPYHADDNDNWVPSLPVNGDEIRFDYGNVPCLYRLDHFRDNAITHGWTRTTDYTGQIGLPPVRASNNGLGGYPEYRNQWWETLELAAGSPIRFEKGNQLNQGQTIGDTYLNLDGQEHQISVNGSSGQRIYFTGGAAASFHELDVNDAYVEAEPPWATAPANRFAVNGVGVGRQGGALESTRLILNNTVIPKPSSEVLQLSGSLRTYGTPDVISRLFGGIFEAAAVSASVWGGFDINRGATLKLLTVEAFSVAGTPALISGDIRLFAGGTLDVREATRPFLMDGGEITVSAGATIYDPTGRLVWNVADNYLALDKCTLNDITLLLPANRRIDGSVEVA